MSENEIKENNKLIAKFMGWTVEKNCFSKVEKYGDNLQNERGISVKNRDYHSDWNLLMQVVEKIYIIRYVSNIAICPGRTIIYINTEEMKSFNLRSIESPLNPHNTSIIECWIAVSNFIKTYNAGAFF